MIEDEKNTIPGNVINHHKGKKIELPKMKDVKTDFNICLDDKEAALIEYKKCQEMLQIYDQKSSNCISLVLTILSIATAAISGFVGNGGNQLSELSTITYCYCLLISNFIILLSEVYIHEEKLYGSYIKYLDRKMNQKYMLWEYSIAGSIHRGWPAFIQSSIGMISLLASIYLCWTCYQYKTIVSYLAIVILICQGISAFILFLQMNSTDQQIMKAVTDKTEKKGFWERLSDRTKKMLGKV